ncbi:hypothetical protein AB8A21_01295 [Streptomyces sp. BF23-18]|uniref:hypothetical protein n=1 Tax=Streptomyces sp. BF23-18 TaxID=3240282 RepID=UPI0034E54758
MEYTTFVQCRRQGCGFDRGKRRRPGGKLTQWCGAACYTWSARARRATRERDVTEAEELLRIADLLDARTNPREFVPGLFLEDIPRP